VTMATAAPQLPHGSHNPPARRPSAHTTTASGAVPDPRGAAVDRMVLSPS